MTVTSDIVTLFQICNAVAKPGPPPSTVVEEHVLVWAAGVPVAAAAMRAERSGSNHAIAGGATAAAIFLVVLVPAVPVAANLVVLHAPIDVIGPRPVQFGEGEVKVLGEGLVRIGPDLIGGQEAGAVGRDGGDVAVDRPASGPRVDVCGEVVPVDRDRAVRREVGRGLLDQDLGDPAGPSAPGRLLAEDCGQGVIIIGIQSMVTM